MQGFIRQTLKLTDETVDAHVGQSCHKMQISDSTFSLITAQVNHFGIH